MAREKAHTHEGDAIAAARRRLPIVEVDSSLTLVGANGPVTLLDTFEGRRQLIAYFHMWFDGEPAADQCEGCTFYNGQVRELSYIHSRDVTYATFCQGPYEESERYREFMEWDVPWYSMLPSAEALLAGRTFNRFCVVCYVRHDDRVFETYWLNGRGVEVMAPTYGLLDLTVYGRQETWEDSPDGWPQRWGTRPRASLPVRRPSDVPVVPAGGRALGRPRHCRRLSLAGGVRGSGRRATGGWTPAQRRIAERRGAPGAVCGEVGPGRHDLVDPVQRLVVEPRPSARQQAVELLGRARADDHGGHRRMGDREGDGQIGQRAADIGGELGESLDGVELEQRSPERRIESVGLMRGSVHGQIDRLALAVPGRSESPKASGLHVSTPIP